MLSRIYTVNILITSYLDRSKACTSQTLKYLTGTICSTKMCSTNQLMYKLKLKQVIVVSKLQWRQMVQWIYVYNNNNKQLQQ
jgi:roadblock/LC7 domain-containing protein